LKAFARRLSTWIYGEPYVLLVLTTTIWGGNAVAGKLAVGEISPMALTTLRWIFACAILAVVARRQLIADWPVLKAHRWQIAAMGALGYTAFNPLFYESAHFTTAVNMTILQGSIPVFTFLFALIVFRTPVLRVQLIGMGITVMGVLVLATRGDLARLAEIDFNIGDLFMLVACSLYAGYAVALRLRPKVSAMAFFAAMAGSACLSSLPLLAVEAARGDLLWPTAQGWVIVAFVALFPSLLAQLGFMRGVELIGPGRASIFANLVPVIGSFLAVALLGESFGLHQALALSLVLGGIYVAERRALR
jgi:drug/metabolite transporter (DMT)-like permease